MPISTGAGAPRAKEFLERLGKLNAMIKNKLLEIEQWRAVAENAVGELSGMPRGGTRGGSAVATAVGRYVDIEGEIRQDVTRLVAARRQVLAVIEQLPTAEYELLYGVYVQGQTLGEIAARRKTSYSWATSLHLSAKRHVQAILDKEAAQRLTVENAV